jgi:hypothetical protein
MITYASFFSEVHRVYLPRGPVVLTFRGCRLKSERLFDWNRNSHLTDKFSYRRKRWRRTGVGFVCPAIIPCRGRQAVPGLMR